MRELTGDEVLAVARVLRLLGVGRVPSERQGFLNKRVHVKRVTLAWDGVELGDVALDELDSYEYRVKDDCD